MNRFQCSGVYSHEGSDELYCKVDGTNTEAWSEEQKKQCVFLDHPVQEGETLEGKNLYVPINRECMNLLKTPVDQIVIEQEPPQPEAPAE